MERFQSAPQKQDTSKPLYRVLKHQMLFRIPDYTAELTLPLPEQQTFNMVKSTLKPMKITSEELLRGHQDFEEYIKRNGKAQFHNKMRYITAEYVEKYSLEISKYTKAALVIDTDDEVIYIVLYVDETEVFRKKYTDIRNKWYVKDGNKRLNIYGLNYHLLSSVEIGWLNRD